MGKKIKRLRNLQKMFATPVKIRKEKKKKKAKRDKYKVFDIDNYAADVIIDYSYIKKMDDYYDKHIVWKEMGDIYKTNHSLSISNTGIIWDDTLDIPAKIYTCDRYVRSSLTGLTGIHRLVARYHIPIPQKYLDAGYTEKDLQVNHIDGIRHHNYVYNLEWCTAKENMQHAVEHRLIDNSMEEKSHLATITNKQAIMICEKLQAGVPAKDIAKEMQIDIRLIRHIKNGECWRSISKNYTFPYERNVKPGQITDETVHAACKMIVEGKSDKEISKLLPLTRTTVKRLRLRQTRNSITSQYKY